tara:strand:+ start:97 stop:1140 length:1044 start_codon:yes stop_codon:yes gene_type:complete
MLLSQLITSLKGGEANLKEYKLGKDIQIIKGASLDLAEMNDISFLEKDSHLSKNIRDTKASFVLLPDLEEIRIVIKELSFSWAIFDDPRLAFAESLRLLNPITKATVGIHPSAIIGKNVILGEEVSIGPNTYVGDNTKILEKTIIHPGVVIYEGVQIGSYNELHSNCVIHPKTIIGDKCVIHSNAVIGSEGFGFVPTAKGWIKMPQTGYVIIENDVEIGCNTNVDRPSVGETRIGAGTKIDNLVQIGHGVQIGKACAMASQVGIAGGAHIGNSVVLAGQVGVANRVKVGDKVVASSKCGIHTDIDEGSVISGFPAMPSKLWLRCSATFKRLPEIAKSIRQLNLLNLK